MQRWCMAAALVLVLAAFGCDSDRQAGPVQDGVAAKTASTEGCADLSGCAGCPSAEGCADVIGASEAHAAQAAVDASPVAEGEASPAACPEAADCPKAKSGECTGTCTGTHEGCPQAAHAAGSHEGCEGCPQAMQATGSEVGCPKAVACGAAAKSAESKDCPHASAGNAQASPTGSTTAGQCPHSKATAKVASGS